MNQARYSTFPGWEGIGDCCQCGSTRRITRREAEIWSLEIKDRQRARAGAASRPPAEPVPDGAQPGRDG